MVWSYTSVSPLCLHRHVMEISFIQGVAFFSRHESPYWVRAPSALRLHDHIQTHHTFQHSSGRVISPMQGPLCDNTQTSMAPVGFEPAIPAKERPQTHILDRAATGISYWGAYVFLKTYRLRLVLCSFSNDPLVTQMRRNIQAPVYTVNEIMVTL